jgi:phenylacetate-CoA ligase
MIPPPNPAREAIVRGQLDGLRALIAELRKGNRFYLQKLNKVDLDLPIGSIGDFQARFPFTSKVELVADQQREPPYGSNLTYPRPCYSRYSQTSATTGNPLRWLDTRDSWQRMVDSWKTVFRAADVSYSDTILFAFSFGPFIGFWLAFEAGSQLGALCLPGGALSSVGRLRMMLDNEATVVCCTPTYAMRLAEVAAEEGIELSAGKVRRLIVAGEPGGSIPAVRRRLEQAWPGALVFDHHGMTEVGPVTFQCPEAPGDLRVIESAYVAEVIDPDSGAPLSPGTRGELVLTTLGRHGSPLIRYRTGDLVEAWFPDSKTAPGVPPEMILRGGILGRIDDMLTVRGVNIYPSAIEAIVRELPEIAEYQAEVGECGALEELSLLIEPAPEVADVEALIERLSRRLHEAFPLRIQIRPVAPGELPRYELKARRWKRIGAVQS